MIVRFEVNGAKYAAGALVGSQGYPASRRRYTLVGDFPTTDAANLYGD
jgi:hypothetical protein